MLDSGSTDTWVAENIAGELGGLSGNKQTIRLYGINNEEDLPKRHVAFNVAAAHPSEMHFLTCNQRIHKRQPYHW